MMRIEFSPEETELLLDVLQRNLNEVETEIHRAAVHDFKQMLKQRRQLLERVREKVEGAPTGP